MGKSGNMGIGNGRLERLGRLEKLGRLGRLEGFWKLDGGML